MAKERKSAPRRRKKAATKKPPADKNAAHKRRQARAKAGRDKGGPRPAHRPHTCTAKRIELFAEMCELQASTKDAAEYAGISESCATKWLARGRLALEGAGIDLDDIPENAIEIVEQCEDEAIREELPFVRFFRRATHARAEGRRLMLSAWRNAAIGAILYDADGVPVGKVDQDWRAAQKLMAVRDPAAYAEKHRHDVTSGGDPLQVQIVLPAEEDEP